MATKKRIPVNKLRTIWFLLGYVFAWILAIYIIVFLAAEDHQNIDWNSLWLAGVFIGLMSAWFERRVLPGFTRRYSIGRLLIVRTVFYAFHLVLLLVLLMAVGMAIKRDLGIIEALRNPDLAERLFSFGFASFILMLTLASFIINFVRQVNRMIGPGVLFSLFIGRYHKPVEEDRIFMFLDLKSSTAIAERLGPKLFNNFKNDFFYDVVEPVLETRGSIYQYVGDEVIFTWSTETGLTNHNALRCYFLIKEKIDLTRTRYFHRYGVAPEFRAALHGGTVVTAEIGDLKKDIVHSGDPVNVAARLENQCKELNRSLLVSGYVIDTQSLPESFELEDLGALHLRGKTNRVRVYSVNQRISN